MEQWTIKDFKQPKILPKISVTENGELGLDDGFENFTIEGGDNAELLDAIKQSKTEQFWHQLENDSLKPEHVGFLEVLESMGMVGEGGDIQAKIHDKKLSIEKSIEDAVNTFNNAKNAEKAKEAAAKALCQVQTLLAGKSIDVDKNIFAESNFFSRVLAMQLFSWQRLCPGALQAAQKVLQSILERDVSQTPVSAGLFPSSEIRRCLCAMIWALTRTADSDSAVKLTQIPQINNDDYAINLGILAEKHAMYSLEQLGESKFLSSLQQPEYSKLLASAGYAQEYYITDRFIDLIAPSISKRLPRQLKALLRRYYNEEVGHESFELKTCRALGMNKSDLLNAMPSPFGQLVCDLFSWLAHDEPLAYFATISITEGLPGQCNPINDAVLNSDLLGVDDKFGSKQHEDLNLVLHHQQLPRWFLSECGILSVEEQQRTMQFYNIMLEVSFRAWEELYRIHVQFGTPLNPTSMSAYVK